MKLNKEIKDKRPEKKVILGIDPGSTTIGYGAISYYSINKIAEVLGYGYIDLKNHKNQETKLLQLHKDLQEVFEKYNPDAMAIENVYFFKNSKTFTSVSQSKGVILLTAAQANINICEYTPLQVKQTISGYGKAQKSLIEKLVKSLLNINSNIKPDDASDALAIAICHLNHLTLS